MALNLVGILWQKYGTPGPTILVLLLCFAGISVLYSVWQSRFVANADMRSKKTIKFCCAGVLVVAIQLGLGYWLWPETMPAVTVSPQRIEVNSKGWIRVDTVTVTNHRENPRYTITFTIHPVPPEIEYEVEGPMMIKIAFTDGSTEIPIPQIGPKASLVYEVKSRLKGDAKTKDSILEFAVTEGMDEPEVPGVAIHP
jgi:hypothetical protein